MQEKREGIIQLYIVLVTSTNRCTTSDEMPNLLTAAINTHINKKQELNVCDKEDYTSEDLVTVIAVAVAVVAVIVAYVENSP